MAATSRLACRIPTRKKAFWPIPWPPRTKSVVTSGINERKFTYNGKEYHHVLDPFTGFPGRYWPGVRNHPFGQLRPGRRPVHHLPAAGTWEEGMQLIESLDGVEALFITTRWGAHPLLRL